LEIIQQEQIKTILAIFLLLTGIIGLYAHKRLSSEINFEDNDITINPYVLRSIFPFVISIVLFMIFVYLEDKNLASQYCCSSMFFFGVLICFIVFSLGKD